MRTIECPCGSRLEARNDEELAWEMVASTLRARRTPPTKRPSIAATSRGLLIGAPAFCLPNAPTGAKHYAPSP